MSFLCSLYLLVEPTCPKSLAQNLNALPLHTTKESVIKSFCISKCSFLFILIAPCFKSNTLPCSLPASHFPLPHYPAHDPQVNVSKRELWCSLLMLYHLYWFLTVTFREYAPLISFLLLSNKRELKLFPGAQVLFSSS